MSNEKRMVIKCHKCGADVVRTKHVEDDKHLCTSCIRGGAQWSSDGINIGRVNKGRWVRGGRKDGIGH